MENKNVSTSFTFGNFLVKAELIGDAKELEENLRGFVLDGLTQRLQRKPASKVEKELAGYEKRPDKFKRDSIPFGKESATVIYAAFAAEVDGVADIEIEEYVPNEKEAKFTEERAIIARHEVAGDLETWATGKVDFDGELKEDDDWSKEFLAAVRELKKKILATGV